MNGGERSDGIVLERKEVRCEVATDSCISLGWMMVQKMEGQHFCEGTLGGLNKKGLAPPCLALLSVY